MSEAMIVDVTMNNIQEMVMQNSTRLPVLVSFWSPLNEESRQANQILEKLAAEFAGQFILAKINAAQQTEIAEKFNLPGMPFFKVVRNKDILTEQQGLFSEVDYRQLIESIVEVSESETLRKEAKAAFAAGEIDQAIALLGQAAEAEPSNFKVHLDLVMMYLNTGHLAKAQNLFEKLPEEAQQDKLGLEISGVLFFSDLIEGADDLPSVQAALAENPNNCAALMTLSGYLFLNGQAENGMNTLFRVFTLDRQFQEGLPQKAILKAFDMLTAQAPEFVIQTRRKFQSLLY